MKSMSQRQAGIVTYSTDVHGKVNDIQHAVKPTKSFEKVEEMVELLQVVVLNGYSSFMIFKTPNQGWFR